MGNEKGEMRKGRCFASRSFSEGWGNEKWEMRDEKWEMENERGEMREERWGNPARMPGRN